jgi:hypothetical protein
MKSGEIICRPDLTDSHEDLIVLANIHDGVLQKDGFVRIEFVPHDDYSNIFNTNTWELRVCNEADWFDYNTVRQAMVARVERMFVKENRSMLVGGCWILGEEAKVSWVSSARVYGMFGNSSVNTMIDSSLCTMGDTSKITSLEMSRVGAMCNKSHISVVDHESVINYLHDEADVSRSHGIIRFMNGYSSIGEMRECAQVELMRDFSKVREMREYARIIEMRDNAFVGRMYDNTCVEDLYVET